MSQVVRIVTDLDEKVIAKTNLKRNTRRFLPYPKHPMRRWIYVEYIMMGMKERRILLELVFRPVKTNVTERESVRLNLAVFIMRDEKGGFGA